MLLPGEKELADQLLNLTKTAREQEATIPEQGKILHQMGELYLKDAIETGNGEQFVKASALINAALVRTEDPNDQKALQEKLCEIYKGLMGNIQGATLGFSVEELVVQANSNKDDLHAIRVEANGMSKTYEELFSSYRIMPSKFAPQGDGKLKEQNLNPHYSEALDIQIRTKADIKEEVVKVSSRIQCRMLEFVKKLWEQATEMNSATQPCQYTLVGLGSIARQEITPYSDLEFALLIETDSYEIKQYFKNLVYLFHLLILDLGETPIPALAIESLNDFLSPDADKYFDIITPCGFRLDGAMPWACKTPIGRRKTPQRESLDLIKTPEEMAALLKEDNVLGQAYKVADILCNSIFICGDLNIMDTYRTFTNITLKKTDHKEKAKRSLIEDYNRSPDWTMKGNYSYQSKTIFYRFPSTFVENLRMYFTPQYKPNSNWAVLDHLVELNIISKFGSFNLSVQLAVSYGLRLLTYLKNKGQYESFSVIQQEKTTFEKVRTQNPFKGGSNYRVACLGQIQVLDELTQGCKGLRYVVEKYFMEKKERISDLRTEMFTQIDEGLEYNSFSWIRNQAFFENLLWARLSNELPSNGCGQACGVRYFYEFSYIPSDNYPALLKAIEVMIENKDCQCLSLLRRSLLVSKAILLIGHDLIGNVPKEAQVSELLKRYRQKRYKNMRERFYLLIDIMDLAQIIPDRNINVGVTGAIEAFFSEIATFDESQQTKVHMMKSYLTEFLILLYTTTEQLDKGILLCQQQIDEDEWKFGLDGSMTRLAHWYTSMGHLKLDCGLPSEAVDFYMKALDNYLYHYENIRFTMPQFSIDWEKSVKKVKMKDYRKLAMITATLYRDLDRLEDAIKVLTTFLTKNGKSYDIETDDDLLALCWLSAYLTWEEQCEHKLQIGNQYFEEILETVIEKDQDHQFKPDTVIQIVSVIYLWILRLGCSEMCRFHLQNGSYPLDDSLSSMQDSSYIIENIYRKHCEGKFSKTQTKKEFLIERYCMLVNDNSITKYYLERAHLTGLPLPLKGSDTANRAWHFFFFSLCALSVGSIFSIECLLTPWDRIELMKSLLPQAEMFCEKVIKKIVSKENHKMCLIYVDYCRSKMMVNFARFTVIPFQIRSNSAFSATLHCKLLHYFPDCHKAQMATMMLNHWMEDKADQFLKWFFTQDRKSFCQKEPHSIEIGLGLKSGTTKPLTTFQ